MIQVVPSMKPTSYVILLKSVSLPRAIVPHLIISDFSLHYCVVVGPYHYMGVLEEASDSWFETGLILLQLLQPFGE